MVDLNLTSAYYTGDHPSLLWEMTICQSLGDGRGTFAKSLEKPASYGRLLAEFLLREAGVAERGGRVIEIGGGYGTLMRGLLEVLSPDRLTMLDISPLLLEKQRQALAGQAVACEFICEDLFTWLPETRPAAELLLVNEIIGDLPTITGIERRKLHSAGPPPESGAIPAPAELDENGLYAEAARLITTYKLDISDLPEGFNLNYGALRLVEIIAESNIATTFISEHGSDTMLPYPFSLYSAIEPPGGHINPRRIQLKDHDEYNIRFDHLEQVAGALGLEVKRFHLLEMLGLRFDDEIDYLLRRQRPETEEQEIFLEFYEHLAEYQGMLLLAPGK